MTNYGPVSEALEEMMRAGGTALSDVLPFQDDSRVAALATVDGTLADVTKKVMVGKRGGLFYERVDPKTGKVTRVYLKEYQREKCVDGFLVGSGRSCKGVKVARPKYSTGHRAYGGYIRKK